MTRGIDYHGIFNSVSSTKINVIRVPIFNVYNNVASLLIAVFSNLDIGQFASASLTAA